LKRGAIARQQLSLYNFGTVGHEILRPGSDGELGPVAVHTFDSGAQTTLTRQNNPIRVEVENPAAEDFEVFVSDRQATIRGDFAASDRANAEYRTGVALSGETWVPILTLRVKPDFDQLPVDLLQFSALVSGPLFIQFRAGAGSASAADYDVPRNSDPTETAVEVDRDPTATIADGRKRFQFLVPGGADGTSGGPPTPTPPTPLAQLPEVDLQIKRDQPVTLFARRTTGTGGEIEACNLQWSEGW